MRRIVAFIDVDEEMILECHPNDGVGVAFEEEMVRMQQSGIHVDKWAISDADDTNLFARYLHFLFYWAMDHVENFDNCESPMDFAKWQKNEYGANIDEPYMLISVFERTIQTEVHPTLEAARAAMMAELKEEFMKDGTETEWEEIESQDEFECSDFAFSKLTAWSNLDDDCNCDWQIVPIPPVIT